MSLHHESEPLKVVIAGGGVAALETALALRSLAGERVRITMLAPETDFVYRPMTVREPFSGPTAHHYPLELIARDQEIELRVESVVSVDPEGRQVGTSAGHLVEYDALVLALGARAKPGPPHVLSLDDRRLDDQLHGLVQDVEEGTAKRIAFVVPDGPSWPLPIYELALMTARRAYEMSLQVMTTIVTPEPTPLAVFGTVASQAVERLLETHGVTALCSSRWEVTRDARLIVKPSDRELHVDRIVATPELAVTVIPGLPGDDQGFVPVDHFSRVRGLDRVFAAGDIVDFPVKQGSLAAQQADAAAEQIAALAGIAIDPQPAHPSLHGIVLGSHEPLYLRARLVDGHGVNSEASTEPLWSPPNKIDAQYLGPYLNELDHARSALQSAG